MKGPAETQQWFSAGGSYEVQSQEEPRKTTANRSIFFFKFTYQGAFDTRKQFHTLVSEQNFHSIPWSRILIAQTTYFPIQGPATDQLNVHRHHSNMSQFSTSLLSLSGISAFRTLNNSSITSIFYHLYLKMHLYNKGASLEQGILQSLLWETRS